MKAWFKGGLLGGIVRFVLLLIFYQAKYVVQGTFGCGTFGGWNKCVFSDFLFMNFVPLFGTSGMINWMGLILGFIIGSIIGFIVGKIKSKNKNKNKNRNKK